ITTLIVIEVAMLLSVAGYLLRRRVTVVADTRGIAVGRRQTTWDAMTEFEVSGAALAWRTEAGAFRRRMVLHAEARERLRVVGRRMREVPRVDASEARAQLEQLLAHRP
ncbi:MAG: hypothetical protein AAF211_33145, partial [Myxococcota bacterium]